MNGRYRMVFAAALATALIGVLPATARAHCDGMDGPVVRAAQAALTRGDVDLVLIWVRRQDEDEIRRAFERVRAVRELSPLARDLADTYFFETLVRVHRAGEGAPYTGLKPAGRDLGPAIPAAERALAAADAGPLSELLVEDVRSGVLERWTRALEAGSYDPADVAAGREYVQRYIAFIHYVEGLHEAATRRVEGPHPGDAGHAH